MEERGNSMKFPNLSRHTYNDIFLLELAVVERGQREDTEKQGKRHWDLSTGQPHFFCSQRRAYPTNHGQPSPAQPFKRPCICLPSPFSLPTLQTSPLLRTRPSSSAQRGHKFDKLPGHPSGIFQSVSYIFFSYISKFLIFFNKCFELG